MCGIAGMFGGKPDSTQLGAMMRVQRHRGPDDNGLYVDEAGLAALGHNRLSIIDRSPAGRQPMSSHDGRFWIAFNGEIYNYLELRDELADYPYRSRTDTEVILAAFERWGPACLDRFLGMFSFIIWDARERSAFAARDRFGVKPLYYCQQRGSQPGDRLLMASEIAALRAALGHGAPDPVTWATYLVHGLSDYSGRTFWSGIQALPPGHALTWRDHTFTISCWYDLAARAGAEVDRRPLHVVREEYADLLIDSVRLRFRSDVPVGVNLSGGLDSSTLLGAVHTVQGPESEVKAFTFVTGDSRYDELPWVRRMLRRTRHPSVLCELKPSDVPALATSVLAHQDEPFGGIPTLAYARLFERAREEGVIVLLDGQGMDEQWAGYDYYRTAKDGPAQRVQGTRESPVRPDCVVPAFRSLAEAFEPPAGCASRLRNLQYADTRFTKLPKALRFNDRISMRSSTELREPFLDHRLFELAFRQPDDRKINGGRSKWLLRALTRELVPNAVSEAPKRALQTPQREWLRGPLSSWATDCIEQSLFVFGGDWLDRAAVRRAWNAYREGAGDNSYYVWQWINLGLATMHTRVPLGLACGR
jgi:asparagine synthase (glutamine-hydrolysing)